MLFKLVLITIVSKGFFMLLHKLHCVMHMGFRSIILNPRLPGSHFSELPKIKKKKGASKASSCVF